MDEILHAADCGRERAYRRERTARSALGYGRSCARPGGCDVGVIRDGPRRLDISEQLQDDRAGEAHASGGRGYVEAAAVDEGVGLMVLRRQCLDVQTGARDAAASAARATREWASHRS